MDDLFGHIECRSKSDSIVMRILRSAMDKVHEKLQSKDGPIEFLHGRSTFYELAAILVEGGLNIVQEETEILEGSDKIITDLIEIRDWLHGRIHDMKELIVEKDRELTERLHNETKLQQALELKDRELVNLSEKIEPAGMMKNEEMVNSPTSNQAIEKLKNSVDLQVSNIKQKLEEDEKKSLLANERRTRKTRLSSPNLSFDFLENEKIRSSNPQWFSDMKSQNESSRPDENVSTRRMSSDIDILKETIDLAFGRMQKALPAEKQWRWNIEKDIESILVKGFLSNLQQSFDVELKKKVALLKDNWFDFIDEMRFLCRELKGFFTRNNDESSNPFLAVQRTASLPDISCIENNYPVEEDSEGDDGIHSVAKMIKNHESIIRKQNEEWNWLTREVIQRSKRDHKDDSNRLERRIQDAITRLDNLIERNHKLVDQKGDSDRNRFRTKRRNNIPKRDKRTKSSKVESFKEEIEKLKEERNELCFQISVMEDTYQLLFRGMVKDITTKSCEDTQRTKKNDSCELDASISTRIMLRNYLESAIREDLYVVVFQETVKLWKKKFVDERFIASRANKLVKEKTREIDSVLQEHIRSLLKEEVYVVYFREIAEAWRSEKDDYAIDSSIKEDIYHLLIKEALKNVYMNLTESESQKQLVFQEHMSTPRSRILDVDNGEEGTPRSRNGDESLIQKFDSLLKCVEAEENLMLSASSEIKEHSVNNSLVILNCEEVDERKAIEWLITDDESTFSSVSRKLERALQQLYTSKELLVDMEQTLEVSDELGVNNEPSIDHENRQSSFLHEKDDQGDKVLNNIIQFQRVLANIERVLHEKLESKCLRVEVLKREVKTLTAGPVALMRRRKFQYKRAFISRCQNLRLAETEVDLLGDQVEALVCLLQRIYDELNQNAPVLSAYFEVYDILKLINRELMTKSNGTSINCKPDYS